MQPSSDHRAHVTEDPSSFILSFENSPLTSDVHRCLTGADYLGLPEPHERPLTDSSETDSAANQGGNDLLEQESLTPRSASSDTDSLTQRVASLLNRSGDYQNTRPTSPERTPLAKGEAGITSGATGSADMAANFSSGSFLTSSRVAAQNSLSTSPSKTSPSKLGSSHHFSYYTAAAGSSDDLVAPPPEFADPTSSGPNSVPKFSAPNSAVQTLLKSLEWDHAWDVSAPTGFSTRTGNSPSKGVGNASFSVDSGRIDPQISPKRVLGSNEGGVAMPSAASPTTNKPNTATSPTRTPSTSPDFSSAKYFSEMKHLVEEQMQRREALIAPLFHGDFSSTTSGPAQGISSYSNGGSSTVTSSRRYLNVDPIISTASSSDTLAPPPQPPPPIRNYDFGTRAASFDYNSLDLNNHRLPPAGPTRSSYLRSDLGLSNISYASEYRSRSYGVGETGDRLSASQSDLTTVTPRTGSGLSFHHHHHHDLGHFELHSRVADILSRRTGVSDGTPYSEEHTHSSPEQSEEATTVESTHPGSNDAIPPSFPPNIYGNRPAKAYPTVDTERVSSKNKGALSSIRSDASVQTSASRLPSSWTREIDIKRSEVSSFPSMTSSGVQTTEPRHHVNSRVNTASVTDTFSDTYTKPSGPSPTSGSIGNNSNVDLKTIVGLLEEPIRAAVRKCLETELRNVNIGERISRPTSRASETDRRSPTVNNGRSSSSLSHHRSNEHVATTSPTATETLTTATGHIERMLEVERRIAELAKLKADEQAKRVRRLEEVLSEQTSAAIKDKRNEKVDESATLLLEDRENRRPSRSPSHSHSPGSNHQNRSRSHSHSPVRSPARSPQNVSSPMAWFVPANDLAASRQKRGPKTKPPVPPVRMDFAAPSRYDHNYLTGRIQQMLEPISPPKSRDELTLQDSLRLSNRSFIIRSSERLRRLRLHAIERKLSQERKKAEAAVDIERDSFLEEQAKKIEAEVKPRRSVPPAGIRRPQTSKPQQKFGMSRPKTTDEMLFAELLACDTASVASTTSDMKRIRAETHRRAMLLPEKMIRVERERRALQAKQNRLRSEIFKQKVLNKLLGRKKWTLPRCLCSDSVLDRVLLQ